MFDTVRLHLKSVGIECREPLASFTHGGGESEAGKSGTSYKVVWSYVVPPGTNPGVPLSKSRVHRPVSHLNIKMSSYQYRDSHYKIRRSNDRLNCIMENPYAWKDRLYIETDSRHPCSTSPVRRLLSPYQVSRRLPQRCLPSPFASTLRCCPAHSTTYITCRDSARRLGHAITELRDSASTTTDTTHHPLCSAEISVATEFCNYGEKSSQSTTLMLLYAFLKRRHGRVMQQKYLYVVEPGIWLKT